MTLTSLGLRTIRTGAQAAAQWAPVPWIGPVAVLLVTIIDVCNQAASNKHKLAQLHLRCQQLVIALHENAGEDSEQRNKYLNEVESTLATIKDQVEMFASKSRVSAIIAQDEISSSIQDCHSAITDCLARFHLAEAIQSSQWREEFDKMQVQDRADLHKFLSSLESSQEIIQATQGRQTEMIREIMQTMQSLLPPPYKEGSHDRVERDSADRGIEHNLWALQKSSGLLLANPELSHGETRRESDLPVSGSGTMDVYEGLYLNKEKVAIKVLRALHRSEDSSRRLRREADVWRQVWEIDQGKHILPLYGFGQNEGIFPYFVSPWQDNGHIQSFLKANPGHDHIKLVRQICEGIRVLHHMDPPIVHGDLKGKNVLISKDTTPLLSDFGFSKVVEDISGVMLTMSTGISNSHRWLAPELSFDNGRMTTASDIYSLGMLFLEILTHHDPWMEYRQTTHVIVQVADGETPRRPRGPEYSSRGLNNYIWKIMKQCWSREIAKRPSIDQLIELLKDWKIEADED